LDILNEILPYRVKEKLLPEMRKDLADHSGASMHRALIPAFQDTQSFMVENDCLQRIQPQGFLFGKYDSSMKKYAHASAEKAVYEESLENKMKESGRLRSNLEVLKNQSSVVNSHEIDSTVERLSACEIEMAELKERLKKVEGVIQEEDMQARRGKSVIMVGAKMTEEQLAAVLREKEEQYERLLKEREDELRRRMEEEMYMKMKDLKHRVEIQETQLQIKELELRNARMTQETGSPVLHDSQTINVSRIVPPPTVRQYGRIVPPPPIQQYDRILPPPVPQYGRRVPPPPTNVVAPPPPPPLTNPPQLNVLLQELLEVASGYVDGHWYPVGY
jgi:hypothetical protein